MIVAVAVIEVEKEEVDPIVGQIVTDQTAVAVTTNQQANQGKTFLKNQIVIVENCSKWDR